MRVLAFYVYFNVSLTQIMCNTFLKKLLHCKYNNDYYTLFIKLYYHIERMIIMTRLDKHNYYLDIAESVLNRSTCLRRKFGAIIVQNDEIISTGYNGAPRGRENCSDLNYCTREKLNIPRGERYEMCRSVHAEANAIISAPRRDMLGATLYLVGKEVSTGELISMASSCSMCKRLVLNAGIETVIVRDTKTEFRIIPVSDWIKNDDSIDGTFGY